MATYRKRTDNTQPAGELRHRAAFLKRQVEVKSGVTTERWATAFTCWAMVEPLNSREYWDAAAVNREDEQRVTIRYRRDIDTTFRVQCNGAVYAITSLVNPNARSVKLEMLVKSVVPDGKGG